MTGPDVPRQIRIVSAALHRSVELSAPSVDVTAKMYPRSCSIHASSAAAELRSVGQQHRQGCARYFSEGSNSDECPSNLGKSPSEGNTRKSTCSMHGASPTAPHQPSSESGILRTRLDRLRGIPIGSSSSAASGSGSVVVASSAANRLAPTDVSALPASEGTAPGL